MIDYHFFTLVHDDPETKTVRLVVPVFEIDVTYDLDEVASEQFIMSKMEELVNQRVKQIINATVFNPRGNVDGMPARLMLKDVMDTYDLDDFDITQLEILLPENHEENLTNRLESMTVTPDVLDFLKILDMNDFEGEDEEEDDEFEDDPPEAKPDTIKNVIARMRVREVEQEFD